MLQLGNGLGFPLEPRFVTGPLQSVAEHLQCHKPVQRHLRGEVDNPHASRADSLFDPAVTNHNKSGLLAGIVHSRSLEDSGMP